MKTAGLLVFNLQQWTLLVEDNLKIIVFNEATHICRKHFNTSLNTQINLECKEDDET